MLTIRILIFTLRFIATAGSSSSSSRAACGVTMSGVFPPDLGFSGLVWVSGYDRPNVP